MRRNALFSCLSLQAKNGTIIGLEGYKDEVKTKDAAALLEKLPVELGRRILFVTPEGDRSLTLSVRNIPNVKTVRASYLNPEDVLVSNHIIFVNGAIEKAEEVFTGAPTKPTTPKSPKQPNTPKQPKKSTSSKNSTKSKTTKAEKTSDQKADNDSDTSNK